MDRKRQSNQSGQPLWPQLENELHSCVLNQRELGLLILTVKIRCKARILARVSSLWENYNS